MPASGSIQVGLAGTIKVNASVDPAQGGDPARLRDGGISNPGNPAYVYNTTGAAGYSDRLNQLLDALDQQQSFDPAAAAGSTATLSDFAVVLGRLAAGGAQIRDRRCGLQEHLAAVGPPRLCRAPPASTSTRR